MEWRVIRCSIKWFCIYNWRNYCYRCPEVYQIPVNIGDVVDFNYTFMHMLVKIHIKYSRSNGVEIIHMQELVHPHQIVLVG